MFTFLVQQQKESAIVVVRALAEAFHTLVPEPHILYERTKYRQYIGRTAGQYLKTLLSSSYGIVDTIATCHVISFIRRQQPVKIYAGKYVRQKTIKHKNPIIFSSQQRQKYGAAIVSQNHVASLQTGELWLASLPHFRAC